MNRKFVLAVLMFVFAMPSAAPAATLISLIQGGELTVGSTKFNAFSSQNMSNIDLSLVDVMVGGTELNPNIQFEFNSHVLKAENGRSSSFDVDFSIFAGAGNVVQGLVTSRLLALSMTYPNPHVNQQQPSINVFGTLTDGVLNPTLHLLKTRNGEILNDSDPLGPANSVLVHSVAALVSNVNDSGAELKRFGYEFNLQPVASVPEPSTLLVWSVGILGALRFGRRRHA